MKEDPGYTAFFRQENILYQRRPKRIVALRVCCVRDVPIVETYIFIKKFVSGQNTIGMCLEGEININSVLNYRVRFKYHHLHSGRKPKKMYTKSYVTLTCAWFGIQIT